MGAPPLRTRSSGSAFERNGCPGELTEHRLLPPADQPPSRPPVRPAKAVSSGSRSIETGPDRPGGKSPARASSKAWRSRYSCARQAACRRSRLRQPIFENCFDGTTWTSKCMSAESVAAELRRQPLKRPGCIRLQIEPRGHAVHGVDHAAELRDEECVHHACRGKLKLQRHAGGNGERIDGRDFLIGQDDSHFQSGDTA